MVPQERSMSSTIELILWPVGTYVVFMVLCARKHPRAAPERESWFARFEGPRFRDEYLVYITLWLLVLAAFIALEMSTEGWAWWTSFLCLIAFGFAAVIHAITPPPRGPGFFISGFEVTS
jgi:hypothetical protein